MKNILRNAYTFLLIFKDDPFKKIKLISKLPIYFHDLNVLESQSASTVREFPLGKPYPCLNEKFADSGIATGHYFHQDLLVARRINLNSPHRHVDVGSRIDGFVAHVAAFREIEVFDVRPLPNKIPNVTFKQVDMMAPIQESLYEYCDSLSCLHAIEHFGLGRYGDGVNYDGYLLGLNNLYLMLKNPDGHPKSPTCGHLKIPHLNVSQICCNR